jgi:hypothetical protein
MEYQNQAFAETFTPLFVGSANTRWCKRGSAAWQRWLRPNRSGSLTAKILIYGATGYTGKLVSNIEPQHQTEAMIAKFVQVVSAARMEV